MHTYEFDEWAEMLTSVALSAYRRGEVDASRATLDTLSFADDYNAMDDVVQLVANQAQDDQSLDDRLSALEKYYLGIQIFDPDSFGFEERVKYAEYLSGLEHLGGATLEERVAHLEQHYGVVAHVTPVDSRSCGCGCK